jgi:hypothetical protein
VVVREIGTMVPMAPKANGTQVLLVVDLNMLINSELLWSDSGEHLFDQKRCSKVDVLLRTNRAFLLNSFD